MIGSGLIRKGSKFSIDPDEWWLASGNPPAACI